MTWLLLIATFVAVLAAILLAFLGDRDGGYVCLGGAGIFALLFIFMEV